MGCNEANLVKGYLKLVEELELAKQNGDLHAVEVINAKIEGVIFGYESYSTNTFNSLLKKWEWYKRD